MTGYTVDFDIYTGREIRVRTQLRCGNEVSAFQGYKLYVDNLYSSPDLFVDLRKSGITATGTFRSSRRGLPTEVVLLKAALEKAKVPRGTGYYYRDKKTNIVYCVWKGTRVVSVMSTCHPGHQSEIMVSRSCTGADGKRMTTDKSDQYLAYHIVLRKTVRYWKTSFYHMIDVAVVNAFILYNHLALLYCV